MMGQRIYFDNASTTPVDNRVVEAMVPCFGPAFGNPSSIHRDGTAAKEMIEEARAVIARSVNACPSELYFTSGGTEANNWAMKGTALADANSRNHIIISCIEHECIMNSCRWLRRHGYKVSFLPVGCEGLIDPDRVRKWVTPDTFLISVMHANNEIGTIQPVREIGTFAREQGILFHTDACQTFGKIPIDVEKDCIDLMTINAHKLYGPKGIGALYVRKGVAIEPLLHGGGQEREMRSTTENVPGIVGFARAAELCLDGMNEEAGRLEILRNEMIETLSLNLEGFYLNGDLKHRLPGNVNFGISGMEGEGIRLLLMLDEAGVSVSAGSACSSNKGANAGSHVLKAIGRNPVEARGSVRVSLGRFNTLSEVREFCLLIKEIGYQLKPIYSI